MTELATPPGAHKVHEGKVRTLFALPDGNLLMVASNKLSAFDYVLEPEIPDKGAVLTQLSQWWFEQLGDLLPNHVVSNEVPAEYEGRAVICEPLEMVMVECVARGYLAGTGLPAYRENQAICGVPLPAGLEDGSRLPEPIFTPTTKAPLGEHDEAITYADVEVLLGAELAAEVRKLTLEVYAFGERVARERGIILADTKVEFGLRPDGTIVLADEVLTPDSARFWPADAWEPGHAQPSFDKQFVRDWLTSPASGWSPTSGEMPPPLPDDIVAQTRDRYVEAYERLTGRAWS